MMGRSARLLNIGWFSTGRGEGSQGLLRFVQERINQGKLDARIQFVFSNRGPSEAEGSDRYFDLVESYQLPLVTLSSAHFRKTIKGSFARHRGEFDQQALDLLKNFNPDICVLAGYMLILGGAMCRKYPFLNLHPALPDGPIGTWQEVIWELIETRATRTGAMIHLATEEVDRGPVVSYCTVPIVGEKFRRYWDEVSESDIAHIKSDQAENYPLFQLIRQVEYEREPYLLFETLRKVAEGSVIPRDAKLFDSERKVLSEGDLKGLCLDAEISSAMAEDGIKVLS